MGYGFDGETAESLRASVSAFATAMSQAGTPLQVMFELLTYQTISLTATEVSGILTTLYGQNNIWANTGDVEVTYPADTKLYIDDKITQAIANALNS